MQKHFLSRAFLILLIISVFYAVCRIFAPFFVDILAATILVTIFYKPYEKLLKLFRGRKNIASFVMVFLIALLVIIPLANFIVYTAQRSIDAYEGAKIYVGENNIGSTLESNLLDKINYLGLSSDTVKDALLGSAEQVKDSLAVGAGNLIVGTTNFILSLFLIILTMFFFFADGKKMLEKLMYWTPLSNKYDKEIFKKFHDVSVSTMFATFVTAIAQGLIGSLGFMIVGVPAFFPGIAMGFLSILPYIGSAFVWVPTGIYLLFIGKIWQGVFLLVWGGIVISNIDNLLRAYIIKNKAEVHPIFIIFSILGGISLFGFWGVIFGPLIISIAVTILHIYEMEYGQVLEK